VGETGIEPVTPCV